MASPVLVEVLQAWMTRTLADRRWSASEWARRAGVAPSTITRFLKHGTPLPSARSLHELADAAGSPVPLAPLGADRLRRIKLYRREHLVDAALQTHDFVTVLDAPSGSFAVEIEADAAIGVDLLAGDLLIVLPPEECAPVAGALVVARYDGKLILGTYAPPHIVARGRDPATRTVPLDQVGLLGTAVQLIRKL